MKKGFTLIELIVVILICAMMLAIFVPACNRVRKHKDKAEVQEAPIGVVFNNDAMFNKENRFKTQTVYNTQSAGTFHFCPRCGFDLYSASVNSPYQVITNEID